MGIDEPGNERHVGLAGSVFADGNNPAAGDRHNSTVEGRLIDRQHPAGAQCEGLGRFVGAVVRHNAGNSFASAT
jgi:hypothetical protein